jgi:hypothetical protein
MEIKSKLPTDSYRDNFDRVFKQPMWIKITDSLPLNGRVIEGRNETGGTWTEIYDSEEPLGRMVEWRYLN